jgi:hypothetical protein
MRTPRSIFRARALEEYQQQQEKTEDPRFLPRTLLRIFYLLSALFLLTGLLALGKENPVFLNGSGVVLAADSANRVVERGHPVIGLFLPAWDTSQVHTGAEVQLEIGPTGLPLVGRVRHVEAKVLNPTEARQRYRLSQAVINQPSRAVLVTLVATDTPRLSAGEAVRARIQVGTQSILSLLFKK